MGNLLCFVSASVTGGNTNPSDPPPATDTQSDGGGVDVILIAGCVAGLAVLALIVTIIVYVTMRCRASPSNMGARGMAESDPKSGRGRRGAGAKNNQEGQEYTELAFRNNAYAREQNQYLRPPPDVPSEPPPSYYEAESGYGISDPPQYDYIEPTAPQDPQANGIQASEPGSLYVDIIEDPGNDYENTIRQGGSSAPGRQQTTPDGAYLEPVDNQSESEDYEDITEHAQTSPGVMRSGYTNNAYDKPSSDDLIIAKSGLKPTGARLSRLP